jgi:hypothetical protein
MHSAARFPKTAASVSRREEEAAPPWMEGTRVEADVVDTFASGIEGAASGFLQESLYGEKIMTPTRATLKQRNNDDIKSGNQKLLRFLKEKKTMIFFKLVSR